MKLSKRRTLKHSIAQKEFRESEFIPYDCHLDKNIVVTKDKSLVMVIKMEGFAFETADDEDLDLKKSTRNNLFKSISTGNFAIWFHTVRRKQHAHVRGDFDGYFTEYMNDEWEQKHVDQESFVNELYMSVVLKKGSGLGLAGKIFDLFTALEKTADKDAWKEELRSSRKEIREVVQRLNSSLKDYKPKVLGIREGEKGTYSEVLEFFGTLVNMGDYSPMLVPTSDAASYLPTHRLYFGKKSIESRAPDGSSKFAGCISIKDYSPKTNAGMFDAFLQLPFELVITQSYEFTNRSSAIGSIGLQQRRMSSAGDKAVSQMEELSIAMDMAMSGHIAFGNHHFSVFVVEDELERLETSLSLCFAEIINVGLTAVREKLAMQACYWAQLPGNYSAIARPSVVNTLNLAGFVSLHNYPVGKRDGNHWGPAVCLLDTTSGTPFYFSFHVRDVGHSMIIGPTGAGKTVLMNFLMAQAQKFDPRMFFFDKDRGAEIFIRAVYGQYTIIDPSAGAGFNPCQLDDRYENKLFLAEWLRALVLASHNVELTPEEKDRIAEAVEGNYKLPQKKRKLSNIVPFLGIEGPGTLASRSKMWRVGETHGGLFDNDIDSLDFTKAKSFGFEMAKVLSDGMSLGPVLLYLFHKINIALDGTPTIIVLDEAWALIDNDIFAPKIKDWLKVLRKLNAMVIFATQSVEDIAASPISDTLTQQTPTQIFLPNAKGTTEYQRSFMLSDREYSIIKTTDPGTRFFLVKQGADVVVARVDLYGMDNVINVLSGRAETVLLLDEVRAEYGDRPEDWLDVFYEEVKKV